MRGYRISSLGRGALLGALLYVGLLLLCGGLWLATTGISYGAGRDFSSEDPWRYGFGISWPSTGIREGLGDYKDMVRLEPRGRDSATLSGSLGRDFSWGFSLEASLDLHFGVLSGDRVFPFADLDADRSARCIALGGGNREVEDDPDTLGVSEAMEEDTLCAASLVVMRGSYVTGTAMLYGLYTFETPFPFLVRLGFGVGRAYTDYTGLDFAFGGTGLKSGAAFMARSSGEGSVAAARVELVWNWQPGVDVSLGARRYWFGEDSGEFFEKYDVIETTLGFTFNF